MPRSSTRRVNWRALVPAWAIGCLLAYFLPLTAGPSLVDGDAATYAEELPDDGDEAELAARDTTEDVDAVDESEAATDTAVAWTPVAGGDGAPQAQPGAASLAAPISGSAPDNPFENTCDGKAIGFAGPGGDAPRMEFRNVPAGAVLECRTGHASAVEKMPFASCGTGEGAKRTYQPVFAAEGRHRTEVRYRVGTAVSATVQSNYYVHHSLDRVACCRASVPDTAWFDAARGFVKPAEVFDAKTRLDNPFITIAAPTHSGGTSASLLSLRRTFRLSADKRLLLIRRTMASRRTFEKTKTNSCVGLSIAVPKYERSVPGRSLTCSSEVQSPFHGGLVDSKCPGVYCTVTSCRPIGKGCIQVTHTFNRGPGQKPWVVPLEPRCPVPPAGRALVSLDPHQCDAYVLNRRGQAVCLVNDKGKIRAEAVMADASSPLGLSVLKDQRSERTDHYVFSAKAAGKKPVGDLLFLPQ